MNIPSKFFKYQSLGNDFIIFDFSEISKIDFEKLTKSKEWSDKVKLLCDRHFGVGADGLLIITQSYKKNLFAHFVTIFNSDGSKAELCLNGLRCVAKYLYSFQDFSNEFDLLMGGKLIRFLISSHDEKITMTIPAKATIFKKDIEISLLAETPIFASTNKSFDLTSAKRSFVGHFIDVGNPHFVILEKTLKDWLSLHGELFEKHLEFPDGVNTEFVWEIPQIDELRTFEFLVYERGCGITLSCSSGALATIKVLHNLGIISTKEPIKLKMLGGEIKAWIDEESNVVLCAGANQIFEGILI